MNSRERVLAVLAGEIPDRVPWIENYVSNEVMAGLLGHENFVHCTYSQKIDRPGMIRVPPEIHQLVPIDNLSYDLAPPRFAKSRRTTASTPWPRPGGSFRKKKTSSCWMPYRTPTTNPCIGPQKSI